MHIANVRISLSYIPCNTGSCFTCNETSSLAFAHVANYPMTSYYYLLLLLAAMTYNKV